MQQAFAFELFYTETLSDLQNEFPLLVDYPCCLRIMNVWENRTDTLNGNALRNILLNIGMNHEKDFAYRR